MYTRSRSHMLRSLGAACRCLRRILNLLETELPRHRNAIWLKDVKQRGREMCSSALFLSISNVPQMNNLVTVWCLFLWNAMWGDEGKELSVTLAQSHNSPVSQFVKGSCASAGAITKSDHVAMCWEETVRCLFYRAVTFHPGNSYCALADLLPAHWLLSREPLKLSYS